MALAARCNTLLCLIVLWACTASPQAKSLLDLWLNSPDQWPPYTRGKGQYKFVLSPRALNNGITYEGSNERLRVVLDRWRQGDNLTISTIGGSITFGQGSIDSPNYPQYVENYLQDNYGPDRVHLVNGALCAIRSSYMALCHNVRVPRAADIIIVEYNFNDPSYIHPPFENDFRRAYERLIRKLLSYPRKPAVILMHSYSWTHFDQSFPAGTFWSTAEADHDTVAHYYHLPTLSLKTACYHLMRVQAPGFWVNATRKTGDAAALAEKVFNHDSTHPNGRTGARVMAELVINLIEGTLRDLTVLPVSLDDKAVVDLPLPPPMIPNNHHSMQDQCFMGQSFTTIITRAQGFEWMNDSQKPGAKKYGMVATTVGAVLELTVDTRSVSARSAAAASMPGNTSEAATMLVQLAHLQSYENVGTAEASCVSGCACKEAKLQGYTPQRNSQLNTVDLLVTQHEKCTIRITVLNETMTGSHKVRISACVVSEDGGSTMPNDQWQMVSSQWHAVGTGTVQPY